MTNGMSQLKYPTTCTMLAPINKEIEYDKKS